MFPEGILEHKLQSYINPALPLTSLSLHKEIFAVILYGQEVLYFFWTKGRYVEMNKTSPTNTYVIFLRFKY